MDDFVDVLAIDWAATLADDVSAVFFGTFDDTFGCDLSRFWPTLLTAPDERIGSADERASVRLAGTAARLRERSARTLADGAAGGLTRPREATEAAGLDWRAARSPRAAVGIWTSGDTPAREPGRDAPAAGTCGRLPCRWPGTGVIGNSNKSSPRSPGGGATSRA